MFTRHRIIMLIFGLAVQFCLVSQTTFSEDSHTATGFHCEGDLTWTVYKQGTVFRQAKRQFQVTVHNKQWHIRTDVPEGNLAGAYTEAYYNGSNLTTLSKFASTVGTVNDSIATIVTNEVPLFDPSAIAPVWLAFCSGPYLSERPNGRIAPIWELPQYSITNKNYPIVGKWNLLDQHLGIPKQVTFWNEGKFWHFQFEILSTAPNIEITGTNLVGGRLMGVKFYDATNAFKAGFTNAIYNVQESSNLGTITLPRSFSLTCFSPRRSAEKYPEMLVTWIIEGRVHSLSTNITHVVFSPDPGLRTITTDITNHRSYPVVNTSRYSTSGQLKQMPNPIKHDKYLLALGCVGIVAIPTAMVLFFLVRWRGKN